jgi:MFS family permease
MHKITHILGEYAARVRAFTPNARLYLFNVAILGAVYGIFQLIFNFYVISLGFDKDLLGKLITTGNLTALVAALPMGYLADTIGRKTSLVLSGVFLGVAFIVMALWRTQASFYSMNILSGMAQSLAAVVMFPFMMENSSETERTYLFSFGQGIQMALTSVGAWAGGNLPRWIGQAQNVSATSSSAYGNSVLIAGIGAMIGVIPLIFLKAANDKSSQRTAFAPFAYASEHPVLLVKMISPMLLTSIGAGLIIPFMNVFFREVYHQPDPVIGTLFAWGSLAMGIGLLIAPPIAERTGKIQLVVITQGLSIPFLILLGFAPIFWISAVAYYMRVALMNMSGPVYQAYIMERIEPSARATVASLVNMSWNFGWAFSPIISGWLQVRYGFTLPFIGTIALYTVSVILYWAFFWKQDPGVHPLTDGT